MPPRGALIAIEGLDRAGKTTQCAHLLSHLLSTRAHPNPNQTSSPTTPTPSTILQKFPDRTTPIGIMIDNYLRSTASSASHLEDHTIHLLFSANRWELSQRLLTLLNAGTTVILDRYIHSGIVFTAAKGLPLEWCVAPEKGLPRPDVVIFLDVDGETAEKRGGYGLERYEKREMQEKVRELFHEVAEREGEGREGWWRRVDAGQDEETVRKEMVGIVEEVLAKVRSGEAGEVGVY